MAGSKVWGAIFLLLLETSAIIAYALQENHQQRKIDIHTRLEAFDNLQRLSDERRGNDIYLENPITVFDTAPTKKEERCASEGRQTPRGLQSTCTGGESFGITSTWFPFLEGCFSDSGTVSDDGKAVYSFNSLFVVGSVPVLNTTSNESLGSFWYVTEVVNATSIDIYCVSEEESTVLDHPVDATWMCDVNGDSEFGLPTASEFSASCGCSTTTSTFTDIDITPAPSIPSTPSTSTPSVMNITPTPSTSTPSDIDTTSIPSTPSDIDTTPIPSTPSDIDTTFAPSTVTDSTPLQSTCTDGESFNITSAWFPFLEGCFFDSGTVSDDGKAVYSFNSSFVVGSVPVPNATSNESLVSFWYVAEVVNATSTDIYCVSEEESTVLDHPVDATWICDVTGDEQFDYPNSSEFSTTCGCSTTTSNTTVTCDDGASFTISSTAVPDAAGCYSDTGSVEEGEAIYSETGTVEGQQNIMVAIDYGQDGAIDIRWVVAYATANASAEVTVIYCYSSDQATGVHPVDVDSWLCIPDSTDETETVTTGEFSVSCGCSAMTSSPSVNIDAEEREDSDNRGSPSAPSSFLTTFGVVLTATVALLAGM